MVETDLRIHVPEGCYGRIASRSGLVLDHHIDVVMGPLYYLIIRTNFVVNRGDRLAQLICEKVYYPVLEEEVSAGNATELGDDVVCVCNASC